MKEFLLRFLIASAGLGVFIGCIWSFVCLSNAFGLWPTGVLIFIILALNLSLFSLATIQRMNSAKEHRKLQARARRMNAKTQAHPKSEEKTGEIPGVHGKFLGYFEDL